MRQLSYLGVLVSVLAAVLPLERLLGTRVFAQGRRLLLTLLVAGAPFVAWDFYAVSRDQWSFDSDQTLGVRVPGGLPIEEVAFFLVIPLAIIFTLEAVRAVRRRQAR